MVRPSSRQDGRVPERRKGGNLSERELAAKLADQSADGVIAVTETLGDLLHRQFFDHDGTQDFILALEWIAGLQEEGTRGCGIHAAGSGCGVFISGDWPKRYRTRCPSINAN